ncbi:MAG: PaaI family thioesterase [Pseudomonadota bacterium]
MTWATDMLNKMKQGTHPVPPVTKTLQLGLIDDWGEGWIRKSWIPKPDLLQQDGTVFGGYIAALFDQAFAFATMTVIQEHEAFRTSNLNISFLSLSHGEAVELDARVVSRSRRLISLEAKLSGADGQIRSLATAQQITTKR